MPRVHHVKKARKAKPKHGIKVGDSYFWWKTRMKGMKAGTMHYSKTRPRPSQLTMSEYFGTAYAIQENIEDACENVETKEDVQMLAETFRESAEQVRELGEQQEEKFNNMPEGLQQGDTGQLLEQRSQQCQTVADELEAAGDSLESWEPDLTDIDQPEEDEIAAQAVEAVNEALENVSWDWE